MKMRRSGWLQIGFDGAIGLAIASPAFARTPPTTLPLPADLPSLPSLLSDSAPLPTLPTPPSPVPTPAPETGALSTDFRF
ncbi:MAG: hypothetical protein HC895_09650 [Leptolyngbyaceae cyanobacterium SM1_3_5]|nr:hypothetical protein [Leptolyngbyaceae cyanobacterium SM1_3_5]